MQIRAYVAPLTVAAFLLVPALAIGAQDSTRTTADSSYSEAQAERGNQVFTKVCLECHERIDMSNPDFRLKWGGQTTFDLFKNISTTMPDSDPGSLPLGDYTDVVAYILRLNGVPAGTADLVADSAAMSVARIVLPAPSSGTATARTRSNRQRVAFVHARPASARAGS